MQDAALAGHETIGMPVGALLLTREWSDWRNGWFWWIQSVYVAPEGRGGRACTARCTAEALRQATRRARWACASTSKRTTPARSGPMPRWAWSMPGIAMYEAEFARQASVEG